MEKFGRESFSESTRAKWAGIKEKASALNDKLTVMVKPIGEKVGEMAADLGRKYNSSDNGYVRSFRGKGDGI